MLMPVFCGIDVLAHEVSVKANIDSVQIWMGQQTKLSFMYNQRAGQYVQTPIFSDVIVKGLEIVERLNNDTVKTADGRLEIKQSYVVTSFEDTLLLIPSFPFVSDYDTVWSKDLSLKVVQPFEIDTVNLQVADIKNVFKPHFSLSYFLKKLFPWLLVLLLILLLVYLLLTLLKKREILALEEVKPEIPPYELAIAKLEKIRQEKLWQQNRPKEYHSDLTDVLREYIEGIYQIPAMEMTSDEILTKLNLLKTEKKSVFENLRQILYLADLVKFAKWNPGPEEHELSLNNAFSFVHETKVKEESEVNIKTEEEIKEDGLS